MDPLMFVENANDGFFEEVDGTLREASDPLIVKLLKF